MTEFIADKRRMTPARRKRILERFGGCCARLGCEETTGLELDHRIAIALGGKDEDENLEPLCRAHHLTKTKLDVKLISKAKRIVKKAAPDYEKKGPRLQSKGFSKDWTRKLNGQVVRRKP